MTVFHQCYFEPLAILKNFTEKYMLSAPPKTFEIPKFYNSTCSLIETLEWANGTALTANPFFTYSTYRLINPYSW